MQGYCIELPDHLEMFIFLCPLPVITESVNGYKTEHLVPFGSDDKAKVYLTR